MHCVKPLSLLPDHLHQQEFQSLPAGAAQPCEAQDHPCTIGSLSSPELLLSANGSCDRFLLHAFDADLVLADFVAHVIAKRLVRKQTRCFPNNGLFPRNSQQAQWPFHAAGVTTKLQTHT